MLQIASQRRLRFSGLGAPALGAGMALGKARGVGPCWPCMLLPSPSSHHLHSSTTHTSPAPAMGQFSVAAAVVNISGASISGVSISGTPTGVSDPEPSAPTAAALALVARPRPSPLPSRAPELPPARMLRACVYFRRVCIFLARPLACLTQSQARPLLLRLSLQPSPLPSRAPDPELPSARPCLFLARIFLACPLACLTQGQVHPLLLRLPSWPSPLP